MEPDTTGASVRGMAPPKAGRTAGASAFRSLARGGVLAASFAAIERLAGYAGWAGYGEGRSRLLLGLAVAATLGALLARPWNRILAEARGSLVVSILALVGLALLLRKPALLPSTGRPWLDAGIVGLLVLVPFAAHFERRRTAPGFAAAGAAGVVLLGGLWTEPAIGLGFTLILCAGAWAVVEAFAWETDDEASGESAAGLCGLLAAGAAVSRTSRSRSPSSSSTFPRTPCVAWDLRVIVVPRVEPARRALVGSEQEHVEPCRTPRCSSSSASAGRVSRSMGSSTC
jgi:hypothetical protein